MDNIVVAYFFCSHCILPIIPADVQTCTINSFGLPRRDSHRFSGSTSFLICMTPSVPKTCPSSPWLRTAIAKQSQSVWSFPASETYKMFKLLVACLAFMEIHNWCGTVHWTVKYDWSWIWLMQPLTLVYLWKLISQPHHHTKYETFRDKKICMRLTWSNIH